jgi:hypothetical protein
MEGHISFMCTVPPTLNLNTRMRWLAKFTILTAVPLGKVPMVPNEQDTR